jgi:hypothetical protein
MRGRPSVLASFLLLACGGETSTPDAQPDTPPSDAGAERDVAIDAPVTDCDGGQPFADPTIEAAVRTELRKPTGAFTRDELAQVNAITATGAASLTGVHCLTDLEVLAAYDGTVENIEPLSSLQKLRTVIIEMNRVRSLLPLSGLPVVQIIRANSNQIASLAGLVLSPGTCGHELRVEQNPIGRADVQPFCELEWVVSWDAADGGRPETCNLSCL